MEWQPIESAPKDGTAVLLFEDGEQYVACWEDQNEEPTTPAARRAYTPDYAWIYGVTCATCDETSWSDYLAIDNPTHWQPLPKEPIDWTK